MLQAVGEQSGDQGRRSRLWMLITKVVMGRGEGLWAGVKVRDLGAV